MDTETAQNNATLIEVQKNLKAFFSLDEIKQMSFQLDIDYEDLAGETKSAKCRSLVLNANRNGRLNELIDMGIQMRSNVKWPEIVEKPVSKPIKGNKMDAFKWSYSSIASVIAGLLTAALWAFNDPGYEPLLAVIGGLAAGAALKLRRSKLSNRADGILAVLIVIVSIIGNLSLNGILFPCCGPQNHAPIIHSFTISPSTIIAGEQASLNVDATDEDGDPLSFDWSAQYGIVPPGNQGRVITYTAPLAPENGIDTIKVIVSDGKDNSTYEETIAIINKD